jgi:hypothetical protein
MAKHTSLPSHVSTKAATEAQDHLPDVLPQVPTTPPTSPDAADHVALTDVHLPPDIFSI